MDDGVIRNRGMRSPAASVDDGVLRNRGHVARGLGLHARDLDEVSPRGVNDAIPPVALLHLTHHRTKKTKNRNS